MTQLTNYNDLKILQATVERELLYYIILDMKDSKLTQKQAQYVAQDYLSVLPIKDSDDLIQKLRILATRSSEAWKTFLKIGAPYIEKKRNELLTSISQTLRNGDVVAALALTKEGLLYG